MSQFRRFPARICSKWPAALGGHPQPTGPISEPALVLQQELLSRTVELADAIAGGRLPRLSLPPKYVATKLKRGVPALAGEPIPVPVTVLTPVMFQLCDALARGGAGEAATHIRESMEGGTLEAASLLTASLHATRPRCAPARSIAACRRT
jgi:hypothetical protein